MGDQHLRFLHDLSDLKRLQLLIRDCVEIKINDYPVREYTQVSGNGRPPIGG